MPFNPKVDDKLKIGTELYTITEHPAAKGMPYGQAGRRATVYQLSTVRKEYRALKVFNAIYRTDDTRVQAEKLGRYAMLPGMVACKRIVLTPAKYPDLNVRLKSLQYSVIMPWVEGTTWQEMLLENIILDNDQCKGLANGFLQTLVNMEIKGIAHCDLSGPNLIIDLTALKKSNGKLVRLQPSLIDLEELYAPGFDRPKKVPAGSSGYAHKAVKNGIWSLDADRFAGAILLSNILVWHNKHLHEESYGEHFFDPDEIHQNCKRQELISEALQCEFGSDVQALFNQAWFSETLAECPPFSKWAEALNIEIEEVSDQPTSHATNTAIQNPIPTPPPNSARISPRIGGPVTGWSALTPQQTIANIPAPQSQKIKNQYNQENFWEWDAPATDPKMQTKQSIYYSSAENNAKVPASKPLPAKTTSTNLRGYKLPPTKPGTTPKTRPQPNQGMTSGQIVALFFLIVFLMVIIVIIFESC